MTRRTLWPLGLYAALSLALFGIPVIGHLGSRIVASDQLDSSQFMWFLAWWPHALLHGLNPFVTHAIFVPEGFNLTWSTAMPGPSIVLAPITLAFGPAVSWNVIQLASPALSAWTCFLLCRHITGRPWPSLAGGFVFGFSPYMLIHLTGGPYLALVALLPLFVLLVLRRVEGSIGKRRFVIAMTLALTAQYLISSEVLAHGDALRAIAMLLAAPLFASAAHSAARSASCWWRLRRHGGPDQSVPVLLLLRTPLPAGRHPLSCRPVSRSCRRPRWWLWLSTATGPGLQQRGLPGGATDPGDSLFMWQGAATRAPRS